jgi:hypothetical protein
VMGHARITITYTFYAPDGSSVAATVSAESMDSGDKATAKAYSVAFRTALLQTLCLPTDEADPDSDTYERSAHDAPKREQPTRIERPQQAAQPNKPPTKTSGAVITEAQTNFINNLLRQTECDEQLLVDQFGSGIAGMSSQVAKKVIDALLSVRKGEAEIVMGSDGKFVIA